MVTKDLIVPTLIAAAGAAIFLLGFLYAVITVGVPNPDASPAEKVLEARNFAISNGVLLIGATTTLVGAMWIGGVLVTKYCRWFTRRD